MYHCKYYSEDGAILNKKEPCPYGDCCYYAHPGDIQWDQVTRLYGYCKRLTKGQKKSYGWVEKKKKAEPVPQPVPSTSTALNFLDDHNDLPPLPDPPLPSRPPTSAEPIPQRKQILPPPTAYEKSRVEVCEDGQWGHQEWTWVPQLLNCSMPYLTCMLIQPQYRHTYDIHFREASILDWEQNPDQPGCWRIKSDVYKQLKAKTGRHAHDFVLAVNTWQDALTDNIGQGQLGVLSKFTNTVCSPNLAHTQMTVTLTILWSGSIRSWVDFSAVWNAHQCVVAELEGFSYFCALPRWGIIITTADIPEYYNFFWDLGVPVYGMMSLEELDSEIGMRVVPPRPAWYSTTKSEHCDKLTNPNLPIFCVPPWAGAWEKMEMIARGVLLCEGEDVFLPYPEKSSQAAQAAQKEREKQHEKQHEVALLKRPHTNGMRYSTLPGGTHKAFRHMLDMLCSPRVLYLPHPIPAYNYAQQVAWHNINLLEKAENRTEFTFFLHTSVFWGIADHNRLARYASMFIHLLPTMTRRIEINRADEQKWTAGILKGDGIELGHLGCGCDATEEKITGDQELIAAIVYTANIHNLLHQLAYLAQPGLEKLNRFCAVTLRNKSRVFIPDFCIKDNVDKPLLGGPLLPTLARVILGEDGQVESNGKVVFTDFTQDESQLCRKHVDHLIDFFVMDADPDASQFFQEHGFKA
ncbi:hypothetical protein K488DRAFT_89211 [Vararia minispora EC-137]|uniref:Uncharacterized protein n=1 Tax=Vararia minispora EC-137 TaxID=1314806 RepID=A0ACB8QAV7_9AGAM|nr:hypothetical protein K488DRAFT_89211 [Vararia minispora EC-137]